MTTEALYKEISYVNHSSEKRRLYANLVLAEPELLPQILDILFMIDDPISCKAAWVFEFVCAENLDLALPHLDQYTTDISKVHLDPAVRPIAKVCEYLTKSYYTEQNQKVKAALLLTHKERITETCFDWLINDAKIAPKAYAMSSLFLLGTEFSWIHPELQLIIERDYQIQSSGFKARARQILLRIKLNSTR